MAALSLKYTTLNPDPDESHGAVVRLTSGSQHVLEIGAATGYLSEAIARQGARVLAIEIDPAAAAVARERGLDVRVGRAEDVLQPEDRFDCVVLADVLEHVAEPDGLLETVRRHLVPDGSLVLSVPNIAHWTIRLQLLRGSFTYTPTGLLDDTHVRFYTMRTLEDILTRHGFSIDQRHYTLGPTWFLHWRLRWYRKRLLREVLPYIPGFLAFQFVWKATLRPTEGLGRQ